MALTPIVTTDSVSASVVNAKIVDPANAHIDSVSNPHGVTKSQIGLSNADNTSDVNKPVSTAQGVEIALKVDKLYLESTADVNYFIDGTSGNNDNNGKTAGTAFRNWWKLRSILPVFIKHNITVTIIGDLLGESVVIDGISCVGPSYGAPKKLTIKGDSAGYNTNRVGGIAVLGCIGAGDDTGAILIKDLGTNDIALPGKNKVYVWGSSGIVITNTLAQGGFDFRQSFVWLSDSYIGTGASKGVNCSVGTTYSNNNSGVATQVGLVSNSGGTIGKSGTQPTGTVANEQASTGGVIR